MSDIDALRRAVSPTPGELAQAKARYRQTVQALGFTREQVDRSDREEQERCRNLMARGAGEPPPPPATSESFDQRQQRLRAERALHRYVAAYGEPPQEMPVGILAHLDTGEQLGCQCDRHAPWLCRGAINAADGRCPCACHLPTRGAR